MRTKELFLNKHLSRALPSVFNLNDKQCIHAKNVYTLIDLPPEEESYLKLKKHVDECQVCSTAFKNFELKCLETKIYIPRPQIDTETKVIFHNEVHDLFKTFELNRNIILKKNFKRKFQMMDLAGISFFQSLTSKSMFKAYAFGLALFIILKKYFN